MCTDGTITFLVDINLMYNPTLQQTNKTTSHRKLDYIYARVSLYHAQHGTETKSKIKCYSSPHARKSHPLPDLSSPAVATEQLP